MIGIPEIMLVLMPVVVIGGLYGAYRILKAAVRRGVEEFNRSDD